jgi:hypothetical protein
MNIVEYQCWCIRTLPITPAERTIFWFMYGFNPLTNEHKMHRHIMCGKGDI